MSSACPVVVHAHHVGIFCKSRDEGIEWWRKNFGFRLRRKIALPLPDGGLSKMCQVRAGGTYLELYDYPTIEKQSDELFWNSLGTKHACFYVENGTFDDAIELLKEKGIPYEDCCGIESPYNNEPGDIRSVYFYDPTGNQFQIIDMCFPDGEPLMKDTFELYRTKRLNPGVRLALHHVGVYVSDFDTIIPWYEKELGMTKSWEGCVKGHDGKAERIALVKGSDYYLELHEKKEFKPQPKEAYWGTYGVKHISLYMPEEELPTLVKYLKNDGAEFNVEHHWDEKYNWIPGGYTVSFFPDPDGTTIEINGTFFPGEGLYPNEPIFDD